MKFKKGQYVKMVKQPQYIGEWKFPNSRLNGSYGRIICSDSEDNSYEVYSEDDGKTIWFCESELSLYDDTPVTSRSTSTTPTKTKFQINFNY